MDLADRIAKDIFTGGIDNEQATSLKLYLGSLYLGAWSIDALAKQIRRHLHGEFDNKALTNDHNKPLS